MKKVLIHFKSKGVTLIATLTDISNTIYIEITKTKKI